MDRGLVGKKIKGGYLFRLRVLMGFFIRGMAILSYVMGSLLLCLLHLFLVFIKLYSVSESCFICLIFQVGWIS